MAKVDGNHLSSSSTKWILKDMHAICFHIERSGSFHSMLVVVGSICSIFRVACASLHLFCFQFDENRQTLLGVCWFFPLYVLMSENIPGSFLYVYARINERRKWWRFIRRKMWKIVFILCFRSFFSWRSCCLRFFLQQKWRLAGVEFGIPLPDKIYTNWRHHLNA